MNFSIRKFPYLIKCICSYEREYNCIITDTIVAKRAREGSEVGITKFCERLYIDTIQLIYKYVYI